MAKKKKVIKRNKEWENLNKEEKNKFLLEGNLEVFGKKGKEKGCFKFKVIYEIYTEYLDEKKTNRNVLRVIYWENSETPQLEYRRQYFSKKYDDWVNRKCVAFKPNIFDYVVKNLDKIKESLNQKISPEDLI